jgi:CRISPR-associated protein Cas5
MWESEIVLELGLEQSNNRQMEQIDLSYYLEPPVLTVSGTIEVLPLAPLSMVSAQPGTYFRTELVPPVQMVYGLIENALGWHLPVNKSKEGIQTGPIRSDVLKGLAKRAKKLHGKKQQYKGSDWLSGKPAETSKSKYFSLLQYHLQIDRAEVPTDLMTYDDLWSMHLRDRGMNFIGGSRIYDHRLEDLITNLRTSAAKFKAMDNKEAKSRADEKYEVGDRKEFVRIPIEELTTTDERKINAGSLGDRYPMYYVSPKKRGFVVTHQPYCMNVQTTKTVSKLLTQKLNEPTAPTYLGTSEGWVALNWSTHV